MPAASTASTHCPASKSDGSKSFGSSVPSPHSRSVNVFMPKWTKAWNSRACQRSCRSDGTTRAAFAASPAGVSVGRISTAPVPEGLPASDGRTASSEPGFEHPVQARAARTATAARRAVIRGAEAIISCPRGAR